ncbi:hypothetical protein EJC51_47495 [Streptomyces aquilus]|uniref:Uncharacterized protein n=1 Tax=Streptomyces aquilus TaxID=2548456 RepID=A0A3Q9BV09_9ACTN|nr:hypothetical protein [Streptomyces aquilus]AZP14708.1 hypothetical protein EJC51_00050 [Streptomyces aquilus]AZP22996.1 hypothetical protein EJC51_47495 [Streptomyces aquilus]
MSGEPRPWRAEDIDDRCETCGAPPGQLCRPWCGTGYTAEDAHRDAELRDRGAASPAPDPPTSHPKE